MTSPCGERWKDGARSRLPILDCRLPIHDCKLTIGVRHHPVLRGGLHMSEREFQARTKRLALQIIQLAELLPKTQPADVLFRQLLRSATSVGANYRAACRAKSSADMINKLRTVEEEADESIYWLELLSEASIIPASRLSDLIKEADQIVAMTVASIQDIASQSRRIEPRVTDRQSAIVNRKSAIANHLGIAICTSFVPVVT
jgi:four helix bundle protein